MEKMETEKVFSELLGAVPDIALSKVTDKWVRENYDIDKLVNLKAKKVLSRFSYSMFSMGNAMSVDVYVGYIQNLLTKNSQPGAKIQTVKTPNGPELELFMDAGFDLNDKEMVKEIKNYIKSKIRETNKTKKA